jgi:wingless-type MMTV integration site family protein 5
MKIIVFVAIFFLALLENITCWWWNLGLQSNLFSSQTTQKLVEQTSLLDFCSSLSGLTPGQQKLCQLYTDHISAIAKGARIGIVECQHQFRYTQWNCSTVSNETVFGPSVTSVASRESAFVHAIQSAGVLQAIARSCRNGDLNNCGCSNSKRPENLNKDWVWGGCGDNVEYGYKFTKAFVDITEKSLKDDKQNQLISNQMRQRNMRYSSSRLRKSNLMLGSGGTEARRSKAKRLMNLHNYEAGRRAVYRLVKIECKCHGVSGSCSMKTCWLKLPSFREVGDYIKDKYDSAIEVRYESRQNQLKARYRRYSKPTKEDLIYIDDSPNYCDASTELGLLGTQGRQCNKNSNGPDSCRIMCCGRGYYVKKELKEEKCKCKFQWCCSVKCETCITEVETYICK